MSEDTLRALVATIRQRRTADADASYTKTLLDAGTAMCAQKFGEEAVETVIAAMSEDTGALKAEAADTIYHLLVLLDSAGVDFDDVLAELEGRTAQSGHAEKAARGGKAG